MNTNPCEAMYEEFRRATAELVYAEEALHTLISPTFSEQGQFVDSATIENWRAVSEKVEAARQEWLKKMDAYLQCQQRSKTR